MTGDARQSATCISVFSGLGPAWRWYAGETTGQARWIFHTDERKSLLERWIRRPHMGRICNAFRCAREGARNGSAAFAAISQIHAFWLSIALSLLRIDTPLLAFSFHFAELPRGPRRTLAKLAFHRIQLFTVHSQPERERYSSHFGIPIDRFVFVRWGLRPTAADVEQAPPLVTGPYLCAMGKDGRDYHTLLQAMKRLPELMLALVAKPYNLGGDIPKNVKVFLEIPWEQAMNILKHCEFMALPLQAEDTSCGHITLVEAMFARKAIVATRSSGIADYFPESYESTQVAAGDVEGWVQALAAMDRDRGRRERCAEAGAAFAQAYCSEQASLQAMLGVFRKIGVDLQ